jgi:hypothetical protein
MTLGQRIKAQMVDSAERALRMTAEDVLKRAARDAPFDEANEDQEPVHLRDTGKVDLVRVGDQLLAKVTFTADHAATQEIGGRRKFEGPATGIGPKNLLRNKFGGPAFIKYRNYPGGGKPHFLGDALKTGVRKYRSNLKKVVAEDIKRAKAG